MRLLIIFLLLLAPSYTQAMQSIDLTTDQAQTIEVFVAQEFRITAFKSADNPIPWELLKHTLYPFELRYEGWNDGCNRPAHSIMAANTQIWIFRATQPGSYELEFSQSLPSPCQAMISKTIHITVH